ncbi:MAG: beta-glucanase, partial [Psychroserpens sp.]|nr:beta-glucanase [Psychroserpens sp.]
MKQLYFGCVGFLCLVMSAFGQQMPIDFEDAADNFVAFGDSGYSFNTDPQDGSNTVGQFFNDGSQEFQGFYLDLNQPVDLDFQQTLSLEFYSFDPNNHNIILKLENGSNADVQVVQNFSVPSPSDWITLNFDFANAQLSSDGTPINATGTYNRVTIFIDGGSFTPGTYLIDNISDGSTPSNPNEIDVEYTDLVWADE